MTGSDRDATLARLTFALAWSAVLGGLAIPGLVGVAHAVLGEGAALAEAWHDHRVQLFAPGYNLFWVAALNALPFFVLAVLLLLHLGTAARRGRTVAQRRLVGALCAWLALFALSLWLHVSIARHPDAQSAIAYFFFPFYGLVLLPAGYLCGRLVARALVR